MSELRSSKSLSLTGRLFRGLVIPTAVLALLLGLGGAWAIHSVVEAVNDRLLGASARAIAETLNVEQGQITLDLPPWTLGMLENSARDNIYYNVFAGQRLITGYPGIPPPASNGLSDRRVQFRYGVFRDQPVRIAAEARRLPRLDDLVVVQVAETLEARRALSRHLLVRLVVLEAALLALASLLVPIGVRWGLTPLTRLRRLIETRAASDFAPLPLQDVPRELRDLVAAFNELLMRLDTATEGTRRFTADASHQMRTPLSILHTHLSVLKSSRLDDPAAAQSLADIEAAADRLQRLLVQLLALARADGAVPSGLALHPVDVGASLRSVAEEYAPMAVRAGVDLRFIRNEDLSLMAQGNDVLLSELFGNLIDNAIRYSTPGGLVAIGAGVMGARIAIDITDEGPGIPPAEQAKVFTRFYRLERDHARAGSGLGLSIVKALADIMDAQVMLSAGPDGRGLHIRLIFPLASREPLR